MSGKYVVKEIDERGQHDDFDRGDMVVVHVEEGFSDVPLLKFTLRADPGTRRFICCALTHHYEMLSALRAVKKFTACMGADVTDKVVSILRKVDRDT